MKGKLPVLLIALLLSLAGIWVALYSPVGLQQRSVFPAPSDPDPAIAALVPGAIDLTIPAPDGHPIRAYWLGGAPGATILYFHGNGVTLGDQVDIFRNWHRAGFNVLAVEYRGYGGSSGIATEANTHADALAAYRYLRSQGIVPGKILVVGWSLGGTFAAQVAASEPVGGVVLLAAFSSMIEMSRLRYPNLPFDRLLTYPLDTQAAVKSLKVPLLVVHGTEDRVVPYAMGAQLYQSTPAPRRLLVIPGGGHSDVFGPQVIEAMGTLIPD